jgi:hypothetical protein
MTLPHRSDDDPLGPEHVDLLITDYLMPGMTGEELTHRARGRTCGAEWWAAEGHLTKPFGILALRQTVGSLIGPP